MNIFSHAEKKISSNMSWETSYKQPIQKQARYVVWNG